MFGILQGNFNEFSHLELSLPILFFIKEDEQKKK